MRAIDINLSAVGALPPSTVHEQPVTLFAERQNGIILDLHKAMELIHARLIRKGTCVDGDKCDLRFAKINEFTRMIMTPFLYFAIKSLYKKNGENLGKIMIEKK